MTSGELISRVKIIYGADIPYTDTEILEYLDIANEEIIRWEYSLIGTPEETPDTSQYDTIKVMAVISALTQHGAEGVTGQSEGSFRREFKYSDMLEYIHSKVIPFVGLGR